MSDRGDEAYPTATRSGQGESGPLPGGSLPGPRPPLLGNTGGWQREQHPGERPAETNSWSTPAPQGAQSPYGAAPTHPNATQPLSGVFPTPRPPQPASGPPGSYSGPPSTGTFAASPSTGTFVRPTGAPGSPPPPFQTAPLPGGPGIPGRPPEGYGYPPAGAPRTPAQRSQRLVTIGAIVVVVVIVVQAVMIGLLSHDVSKAQSAQAAADRTIARQSEDISNLTKRVKGVEERTAGTLNAQAVAKRVLPSVFRVRAGNATGTAFAFGRDPQGGTLLITNYHVVADAIAAGQRTATIDHQSKSYSVTIEKTDQTRDMVVLRTTAKFTPIPADRAVPDPGTPVIVVGSPLGLESSVTTGVVSAVRDDVEGLNTRVIQFDAAINPGNSGGPVINADGQVVGIAQAKIVADGADGLGLAIPIDEACKGLVQC